MPGYHAGWARTVEGCQEWCQEATNCRFFSYWPRKKYSITGVCHLHDVSARKISESSAVAGRKYGCVNTPGTVS